jgi:hypothetical protein
LNFCEVRFNFRINFRIKVRVSPKGLIRPLETTKGACERLFEFVS